jgi:hypothetical protein
MSVEKFKLKDNHTWKSKPGYSICVLDRGLVRFDYPSHWVVEPSEGAVLLHDSEPSMESCDLGVSLFRMPPEVIAELSMEEMLLNSLGAERNHYEQSEVRRVQRPDVEIVWLEQKYIEKEYKRDARFRAALARGATLCLITMNYWSSRAAGLERVWHDVMGTLQIGMQVSYPTAGPIVH